MTDASDVKTDEPVLKLGGAYKESDDHVPSPTDQFGTLDTTDTAGTADHSAKDISPVFEAARAQNLAQAARALDPDDPDVPSSLVILPEEGLTTDQARENVLGQAKALTEKKVEVADESSPAKEEAAATDEETDGRKTARVEAEQQQQGAGAMGGSAPTQTAGTSPEARTSASSDTPAKVGADKAQTKSGDARKDAQKQAQKS